MYEVEPVYGVSVLMLVVKGVPLLLGHHSLVFLGAADIGSRSRETILRVFLYISLTMINVITSS